MDLRVQPKNEVIIPWRRGERPPPPEQLKNPQRSPQNNPQKSPQVNPSKRLPQKNFDYTKILQHPQQESPAQRLEPTLNPTQKNLQRSTRPEGVVPKYIPEDLEDMQRQIQPQIQPMMNLAPADMEKMQREQRPQRRITPAEQDTQRERMQEGRIPKDLEDMQRMQRAPARRGEGERVFEPDGIVPQMVPEDLEDLQQRFLPEERRVPKDLEDMQRQFLPEERRVPEDLEDMQRQSPLQEQIQRRMNPLKQRQRGPLQRGQRPQRPLQRPQKPPPPQPPPVERRVPTPDGEVSVRVTKRFRPKVCQSCMNRRYQDVSPEVAVSLKFGAKVGTAVAGAVVGGHELQHAMHARMRAAREGKRVQVLITMHYSVCPECGRMYVAGGTTTVRELPEFEAPGREPEKEREGPLQIPEEETPLEEAEGAPQEDLSTIMAILQALAQDPDATPEEIARRLQAQGKEVDAATVRRVMAQHPQVQEEEAEEQEDLSIIMSILQALAQDPDATPEEIARRLRAQGKEVDAATVRRVMAQHPRAEERRQVGIDLLA